MKLFRKGFTLPELLLAAAILAFAVSGILLLFSNCILLNKANRNLALATSHAQYVLEGIKNTASISQISTDITNGNWNWNITSISNAGLTPLANETIDTQVSGTDPIQVSVTVNWQERPPETRNVVLRTLITNY